MEQIQERVGLLPLHFDVNIVFIFHLYGRGHFSLCLFLYLSLCCSSFHKVPTRFRFQTLNLGNSGIWWLLIKIESTSGN